MMPDSGRQSNNEFNTSDLAQLRQSVVRELKRAEKTRADVLLLQRNGQNAVLKDYGGSNRGFALLVAPLLVWRETRALAKLDSLDGVPALLSKVNSRAFVMAYCESSGLGAMPADYDWDAYIHAARALVAKMHDAGVVHGDLRNYTNFMVAVDGSPVLVDFVSAVHRGAHWNPVGALLFNACLQLDDGGIYKLKKRYAGHLITPHEVEKFENPGPVEALARRISALVRGLIRSIFRIRE